VSVNLGGTGTRDVKCEVGHGTFLIVTSKNEQKTTLFIISLSLSLCFSLGAFSSSEVGDQHDVPPSVSGCVY
jgi:hypothetical protein